MTIRQRRPSAQTLAVLHALRRGDWSYGLEIASVTGLKSGSLYPILARLDERGLVESRWLEPERAGRPARHAYRLTAEGLTALRENPTSNHTVLALSPKGAV
ncbi:PadR family transcriptional regulator [Caulobacter sp. X]|uniref:PadR family transcriptional regulator n=1 Tax=Caulobacter sp. X TaxID=2048901 RepID=UPI000C151877|nr:PadR family transcriptional regulator [Caulobacter sp. X]PIB95390.1 PadR family transcriptional regulator [Caulobacter sp. X]